MHRTRRIGTVLAVLVATAGTLLGTAGPARADTVVGQSCGEPHAVSAEYYDAFGNAAPCTADFTTAGPGTARITIDVVPLNGIARDDVHHWSLDLDRCEGSVLPSEGPRTFTCSYGPGAHTLYVDKSAGDRNVDLRVDF